MRIQKVKGTRDILPGEYKLREEILKKFREILESYGFRFLLTPTFEYTELFVKSIGEATDIVEKEMYTFKDRGGRDLTLRPEGTAPIVRAYLEYRLSPPQKLAYYMNMFRAERPQKGRFREFWQLGVEVIGIGDPLADAEVIELGQKLLLSSGLKNFTLEINSIGTVEERNRYKEILRQDLSRRIREFCSDCQRRLDLNPLRILDCKRDREKLVNVPKILDYLEKESREHFSKVLNYLEKWGIPYKMEPYLVRGLDYYTRTTFEFKASGLGAQDTIIGGGRYDGLIELFGGEPTPALGFGLGMERLLIALNLEGREEPVQYFIATVSDEDRDYAIELMRKLRKRGLRVEMSYDKRSLKSQMKLANRIGAQYTLIIGEDERRLGKVKRRDMKTGEEVLISPEDIDAT
jgi:histidyl-tRNA synthetase